MLAGFGGCDASQHEAQEAIENYGHAAHILGEMLAKAVRRPLASHDPPVKIMIVLFLAEVLLLGMVLGQGSVFVPVEPPESLRCGSLFARVFGGPLREPFRFYNTTDLVNLLELETHQDRTGKLAEHLSRLDLLILDALDYLPFARIGGQLLFHLISRL